MYNVIPTHVVPSELIILLVLATSEPLLKALIMHMCLAHSMMQVCSVTSNCAVQKCKAPTGTVHTVCVTIPMLLHHHRMQPQCYLALLKLVLLSL